MSDYPYGLDVRPLTTWPGPLTSPHERRRSQFSAPIRNTLAILNRELWHIGAMTSVMEVAIPPEQFRIDGRPRATARAEHPGVVLSLPKTDLGPLRYATDLFTTWQDNLRAIALGLEALRKVERYGITRRGEQYVGFKALPPGTALGQASHMTIDVAVRVILDEAHPGSTPHFLEEQAANWQAGRLVEEIRASLVRRAKANAHPDRHNGDRSRWDAVEAAVQVLERSS